MVKATSTLAWRQVICSFVLLAADSFIATGYSVISVPLGKEFHTSRMLLMLAMTVTSGATALLAPLLGGLLDRSSLRKMMVLGVISLAAGYAAMSYMNSFAYVLVLFGLLIAPANILIGPVAITVLLTRWFVIRPGRAIGLAIAGVAMGSIVYPPICQWLLDHYSWREAFRLMGLLLLVGTMPAALLVINHPRDRQRSIGEAQPTGATVAPASVVAQTSVREILSNPSFWLVAAFLAIVLSGMIGMITNLVPVGLDRGIKGRDSALLISAYGLAGIGAKLGFAALADTLSPRTLLSISLAGFAAGMACLSQAALGYPGLATGVALVGFFGGLMVPMQSFLVPKIFGTASVGRAMGTLSMVTLVALLSTPPLFGRLADVVGKVDSLFVGFAVLALVAIAGVPALRLRPGAAGAAPVTPEQAVL
jgi:MFS family permease